MGLESGDVKYRVFGPMEDFVFVYDALLSDVCAYRAIFFRRRCDLRVEDFPETNRWPGTALNLEVHSGRRGYEDQRRASMRSVWLEINSAM